MGKRARLKKERRLEAEKSGTDIYRPTAAGVFPLKDLERVLLFIIRYGIYLVLFAPLILDKTSFFPFVTPKTIFFRIIVEIILAAFVVLAILNSRYRPNFRNPITLALLLWLAVLVLTAVTGINFERSFWSTYERMTGIFTVIHLLAFFVILTACFKTLDDWEKFLGASIIVGIFLSVYTISNVEGSTRGGGTIGNTSFLAAYLLFDIFFGIALFLSNFLKRNWVWTVFSGVSLLIMVPVLLTSTARGAIASFMGGLFLLTLGYLIFSSRRTLRVAAYVAIMGVLLAGGIFMALKTEFAEAQLANLALEMKPRLTVWSMGWQGWQERLWLGWGPENFNVVFGKYFNPCLFLPECGSEIWFDRAHNIVLDVGNTSGLLGLLSYLAIFAVAIFGLARMAKHLKESPNLFLMLSTGVLLIVYFVQNFLVFDMINSYLVFFVALAFAYFLTARIFSKPYPAENLPAAIKKSPGLAGYSVGIAAIAAVAFLLWFGNIAQLQAARATAAMMGTGDARTASDFFKQALTIEGLKYEPREQFTQAISRLGDRTDQNPQELREAFELGEKEMLASIKENPLDFRHYLFLGRLYLEFNNILKDSDANLAGEKLVSAEEILQKAIALSPTNQQGYWYLAEARAVQGDLNQAAELLQKSIVLEPRLARSHWYLGIVYQLMGDYQQALGKIQEVENLGYNWKDNLSDLKQGIEVYRGLKDYNTLLPLYLKASEMAPGDVQMLIGLYMTYAELGQEEKAREILEKIKVLRPDLVPEEEAITQPEETPQPEEISPQ